MSAKLIISGAILLVAAFVGLNSFDAVSPGEKGVIVTAGQVVGVADPGYFGKTPFLTNVPKVSTRDQIANFGPLTAYTRDQQTATVPTVSVTYRVDPAKVADVYLQYGSTEAMVEQLLNRPVGAFLEQTFGQYNAELAVRDRTKLGIEFSDRIKASVANTPLIIATVNIENFSFPDEYEANINARMASEVAALRAEQDAKKTVIEAQAQADSQLALATARAKSIELEGNATAAAIRARGDALRDSPNLVDLTAAERWDGVLPTTMVPGGATPFVNVGQ